MAEFVLGVVIVFIIATFVRIIVDFTAMHKSKGRLSGTAMSEYPPFCCQAELVSQIKSTGPEVSFVIRVRGLVGCPSDMHDTQVQVLIADITEGRNKPMPVLCSAKQWQMDGTAAFCYRVYNGSIPHKNYVITDWLEIAKIPVDVLSFPHLGQRRLEIIPSIISQQTSAQLACATALLEYYNDQIGYIDAHQNSLLCEIAGIRLAFAVGAAGGQTEGLFVPAIKSWIQKHPQTQAGNSGEEIGRKMNSRLEECLSMYRAGNKLDIDAVCGEISRISTPADRYNVISFCMEVAAAGVAVNSQQVVLLENIAENLQIDHDRFLAIFHKLLPLSTLEEADPQIVLGLRPQMGSQEIIQRLNEEYQKWNARVTHPDAAVRSQADKMLAIIAEARNKHAEHSGNIVQYPDYSG